MLPWRECLVCLSTWSVVRATADGRGVSSSIADECPLATLPALTTARRRLPARSVCGIAEFAGLENDGVEQEETYILHTMKSERKLMCTTRNYFTHTSKYISYGYCLRDLEQQCDRQHKLQHLGHMTYCGHCMISFLYHIFNKYNSKCGIIYVFRLMLETITCRTH